MAKPRKGIVLAGGSGTRLHPCTSSISKQLLKFAASLKPSKRGETEILDLARRYLDEETLRAEKFGRGTAWLDTGTAESLLDAASFVHAIQSRQGLMIACLEEIAFHQSWLTKDQLAERANGLGKSFYGQYLRRIAD